MDPTDDPLAALWRMVDANPAFAGRKLRGMIEAIDARIAAQVVEILHEPRFLALEGAWRGLHHLATAAAADPHAKIRVLHMTRRELDDDLSEPGAFEDSALFARVYDDELGTVGGEPYGALIGDYRFANRPDDLRVLAELAGIGATVLAPVVVAADPGFLGLEDYRGLAGAKRLPATFTTPQYAKWRRLRDETDARYLCLALPRVLARRPYGKDGAPSGDIPIEEDTLRAALRHEEHCWMSAAFVVGGFLVRAFARDGWWRSLADDDAPGLRLEGQVGAGAASELGGLGLLPIIQDEPGGRPSIGTQTVHKPKVFDRREASANAAIAARLPCLMTMSRVAHYVMAIAGAHPGSPPGDLACRLDAWLAAYAGPDQPGDAEARPLYGGSSIKVEKLPAQAGGGYAAVMFLRPRLADDELTTELRIVTRLPWLSR